MGEMTLVQDEANRGLFQVRRSVFTDPAILSREQATIFARCWIYVGHESEVRVPGDFVTRTVTGRPIIFLRDANGQFRVFYNTCLHQGSMVCRVPRGRASTLRCFFHGWTYDTCGQLIGGTGQGAYSGLFDMESRGLAEPPKVDAYRGFVFMNLDKAAGSLRDYLGRAADYLDLIVDASAVGVEVVPGSHRYSTRANWKMLVMNSIDGYHVATTHATYFQHLRDVGVDLTQRRLGERLELGNGHVAAHFRGGWGRPVARWAPDIPAPLKPEVEARRRDLDGRFGPERAARMTEIDRNLYIFPNLVVQDHFAVTIRTFQPLGPERLEVTSWALAPVDESIDMRSVRLANYLTFWGPAGFATPDDIEALETAQRGFADREVVWCDVSKGALREGSPDVEATSTDELQLRAFWRHWRTCLEGANPPRA
jgi:p-cumate 2,3-dioxygenase subunit alpha